tara:strand:+ start:360 stop:1895 length:1536 start_codon:yes stop_codon:yes gene_type:complete
MKIVKILLVLCFLLILTKIDYRLDSPSSSDIGDDASYYFHSRTISEDFDFDYTNQIIDSNFDNIFTFNKNDKFIPVHPIGSTFFTFPFMVIGNLVDTLLGDDNNYGYFIYSLSSIFFLFLSVLLLNKSLNLAGRTPNKFEVLILSGGSGVTYYAFERFSLTHVYEFFGASLIIYLTVLFIKTQSKLLNFVIPFITFVLLSIRWTNVHFFIIPFLVIKIINKINFRRFFLNGMYCSGFILGISLFFIHTYKLYGIVTLNPSDVYYKANSDLLWNLNPEGGSLLTIKILTSHFFNLLVTKEFGLAIFNPVLFVSLLLIIFFLFKKSFTLFWISLICFLPSIGIVLLWQTTASSYGFRYLLSLVPISIFLFCMFVKSKNFKGLVIMLSIFSFFSTLFFETTQLTSLSNNINSFGTKHLYSQPYYLDGYIESVTELNSYLKILFTSYLGVILLKFIILLIGETSLVEFLIDINYYNIDIQNLILETQKIEFLKLVTLSLFFYLISRSYGKYFRYA